jgi:hypothetical protein
LTSTQPFSRRKARTATKIEENADGTTFKVSSQMIEKINYLEKGDRYGIGILLKCPPARKNDC